MRAVTLLVLLGAGAVLSAEAEDTVVMLDGEWSAWVPLLAWAWEALI
jgi:hypothetical protein